jgi:hypothetical protein
MSDLPLQFPVLLLIPAHVGGWDKDPHDRVDYFFNEKQFNSLTPDELQDEFADMRIVDVACRCWRITGTTRLGIRGTSWRKVLNFIFRNFQYRYDLQEEAPMTFEAVRDHVCATIEGDPDYWRDDEALAGESGPPRDEQEMLDEKIQLCRRTTDMQELIDTFSNLGP